MIISWSKIERVLEKNLAENKNIMLASSKKLYGSVNFIWEDLYED